MKKSGYFIIMLWVLMLTGCKGKEEQIILKEAPILHVSNGTETLDIKFGSGGWSYRENGSEWSGFQTDAIHPLMWEYKQGKDMLQNSGEDITLWFDLKPASIHAAYWKDTELGNESAAEQGTAVQLDSTGKETYSFQLPAEAGYICTIYAVWENEDYSGDLCYAFMMTGPPKEEKETEPAEEEYTEGFSMAVEQSSYAPEVEEIGVTYRNHSDMQYEYGNAFILEYWNNNQWTKVEMNENAGFCGTGNLIDAGEEIDSIAPVQLIYKTPLTLGKYRIGIDSWPSGDWEKSEMTYTSEFEITETE